MKKTSIILLAAVTVFAACHKEQGSNLSMFTLKGAGDKNPTASATVSPSSRTSLAADGRSIAWSTSDDIRVFVKNAGVESSNFKASTTAYDAATGIATFAAMAADHPGDEFFAVSPYVAANDSKFPDSGNGRLKLPVLQTAVKGSYDPAAMPAIGYGTIPEGKTEPFIQFYNVCGLVGFTLNTGEVAIDTVTLASGGNENMVACFYYTLDDNHVPHYKNTSKDTYKYIKLHGSFVNDNTYYFVVKPGTYTDLTISFHSVAGDETLTYTNPKPLTVTRNSITTIGSFTIAEDSWTPVENPEKIILTMDNWKSGNKYNAETNPNGIAKITVSEEDADGDGNPDTIKSAPVTETGPTTIQYGKYNQMIIYGGDNTWQLDSSNGLRFNGKGIVQFPIYPGYKLTSVSITSVRESKRFRIVSKAHDDNGDWLAWASAEPYIVTGGGTKTSTANSVLTWELEGTVKNAPYYLILNNSATYISSIVLNYDIVEE